MPEFPLSRAIAMTALAALSAPVAHAAEPKDEPIVVTATVDREIADFVDAITDVPGRDQLTRFERAICPLVAGIPQARKDAVAQRMRQIATAAGIATGKPGCSPNVLVLVTPDKKTLIEKFVKLYPGSMADLSKADRRALMDSTEPAVAWHMKGPPVDADGAEFGENNNGVTINRVAGSASRITAMSRPQFGAAVVVIDSAELTGLTTTQLADYAAMRAFLDSDPAKIKGSGVSTILRILHAADDDEVPMTLTEWDLNALRGFYSVNRNITAAAQRTGMRKEIKDKTGGQEIERN